MKFLTDPRTAKLAKYPAMLLVLIGAARKQPILMMLGLMLAMGALAWAFAMAKRAAKCDQP
jgi:hypothetical protein